MNRNSCFFLGLGMGAALMYVFDPSGGRRRRAATRDQFVRTGRAAGESLDAKARDWSNRAAGSVAEVRSRLQSDRPDDHILVENQLEPHDRPGNIPALQGGSEAEF